MLATRSAFINCGSVSTPELLAPVGGGGATDESMDEVHRLFGEESFCQKRMDFR